MADAYLLSEEDRAILKLVIEERRTRLISPVNRPAPEPDDSYSLGPEVFVARTPFDGIPALDEGVLTGTSSFGLSDDTPGFNDCPIYRVDPTTGALDPVEGLSKAVYNASTSDLSGDKWILVQRDKFGTWWACNTDSQGGTYVARTPAGGIPANPTTGTSDDDLNSAVCDIYKLETAGTSTASVMDTDLILAGLSETVYNITLRDIPEFEWILVHQDPYGTWFTDTFVCNPQTLDVVTDVTCVNGVLTLTKTEVDLCVAVVTLVDGGMF